VRFSDAFYYFKKQLFALALGLVAMYMVARTDYHMLRQLCVPAYLISLALSAAVLLFGDAYNGSRRWLSIGPFSFQPSEFAKPAVILLLAGLVGHMDRRKSGRMAAAVLLLILPIVGLVGTNNLSTAVIILGIAVIMIFISNPRYLPFLWIILAGAGFLGIFLSLESYRLERIAIWQHPEQYEKGYQTMQGLYAIGSGGLFGRGLGNSLQKLGFVPEAQNDMIFSVICEELGLIGALLLMLLFLLLLWRFVVIATHAPDLFGTLIAAGIFGHIAIQVILNIAVVTNTIPNTGITLPFVSYGGTSVLFLMAEMGLGLSVSRCCTRMP
jgi:cell division protein FtsW